MIRLPFEEHEFLEVFERYNQWFWPISLLLWVLSVTALICLLRSAKPPPRFIAALLAFLWFWGALAYHAALFSKINPAAWAFATLFVIEAGLLLWFGVVSQQLHFSWRRKTRHAVGLALIIYALLYPALNLAQGYTFPRMPTFGLPCPTTLLTAGFLLTADKVFWPVTLVPVCWSVIGGSAAFALGVRADLALFAPAILLPAYLVHQTFGRKRPPWTIEVDLQQNLFVIRYCGRIGPDQTAQCAEEVKVALAGVKLGFRLLVDLTDLESMKVSCAPDIRNIMDMCNQKGVAEVVRVTPDPKRDIGLQIMSQFHYRSDVHVTTCSDLDDAIKRLAK